MSAIDRQSQEKRLLPVTATLAGGGAADLSADAVYVAVVPQGARPGDADWKACVWSTDVPGNVVVPLNLPGGFDVSTNGAYRLWVKIADSPETPIIRSDDRLNVS